MLLQLILIYFCLQSVRGLKCWECTGTEDCPNEHKEDCMDELEHNACLFLIKDNEKDYPPIISGQRKIRVKGCIPDKQLYKAMCDKEHGKDGVLCYICETDFCNKNMRGAVVEPPVEKPEATTKPTTEPTEKPTSAKPLKTSSKPSSESSSNSSVKSSSLIIVISLPLLLVKVFN